MNTSSHFVSIIVPCYNREDFIEETLLSIQNQKYVNFECIVVDDGSSDNTVSIVEKICFIDKRFSIKRRLREPKGANTCRNIGFEYSQGDYIVWFDSDDIMLPNYLQSQLSAIMSKEADFSICKLFKYYSEDNLRTSYLRSDWNEKDYESFVMGYIKYIYGVVTDSFLWKRSSLLKNKEFYNESLKHADEYEFIARILCQNKYKFASVDEELVLYRQHDNNYASSINRGSEIRTKDALRAKLAVLEYAIDSKYFNDDLRTFFIIDSLAYVRYSFNSSYNQIKEILQHCGKKNSEAQALLNNCIYIISRHKLFRPNLTQVIYLSEKRTVFSLGLFVLKLRCQKKITRIRGSYKKLIARFQ